jgi:hypothetical protein
MSRVNLRRRFLLSVFTLGAMLVAGGLAQAGSADAVVDKAIQALGGEAKLSTLKAVTWKAKGKISIGGNESEFTSEATLEGLDHFKQTFEGDFGGNKVKGVTVVAGDKGWRQFGDMGGELDKDALANAKRSVYLDAVTTNPLLLKEKAFKLEGCPDEKCEGKAAACIKVTGPDGKDFKVLFSKETGLPIKEIAKVVGFQGDELQQERSFTNYKDYDGVKVATKSEVKHDGEKFLEAEVTSFKPLEKVDPKTFAEPKEESAEPKEKK